MTIGKKSDFIIQKNYAKVECSSKQNISSFPFSLVILDEINEFP